MVIDLILGGCIAILLYVVNKLCLVVMNLERRVDRMKP